jgi:hypothetical protein
VEDFVSVEPMLERDRWDRPLVIPPGGGTPVPYTRATTFVDGIDDKSNLSKRDQRLVAVGIAMRPDLQLSAMAHSSENQADKRALQKVCDDAKWVAGGDVKASNGTSRHRLTELVDAGLPIPEGLPAAEVAMLEAYRTATAGMVHTHTEAFCVQDMLKVGGTPDRIGDRIRDLKTGSIEWDPVKIAAQLAMYARSKLYDIATGERTFHGADTLVGEVIHLPAVDNPADAVCTVYEVDLTIGWAAVLTCRDIREKRALKFKDVFYPRGEFAPPVAVKTDVTLNQALASARPAPESPTVHY